jgi:hypothetical protein
MNMGDVLSIQNKYRTFKHVEITVRGGVRLKAEN